jgi:hypothetical protein
MSVSNLLEDRWVLVVSRPVATISFQNKNSVNSIYNLHRKEGEMGIVGKTLIYVILVQICLL